MTTKRFTQKDEDDWEILDRNKHFAYAHSGYQAGKIIQELNELVETNRELYKENKELEVQCNLLREQANEFHRGARENAKLADKFFKESQFKNHVFTVIDGKIKDVEKELEEYHLENENAMLVGRLWALKELKEELKGDVE